MNCLCCEQHIEVVSPGDDSRGVRPAIVGGNIEIEFGYGSKVHDCFEHPYEKHFSVICDSCWEAKKHLVRTVDVIRRSRFADVPPASGQESAIPAAHSPGCRSNQWTQPNGCDCTNVSLSPIRLRMTAEAPA